MAVVASALAAFGQDYPNNPPAPSQGYPASQYPQQQYPQQQYPQQQYPPQQYPNQQYPPQSYPQPGYPAGQYPQPGPPPMLAPPQLDQLVGRVALYPDPLLAQVLTASTFYDQIPDAAGWADQHSFLTGDALSRAINEDNLPWDPSVLALLPFPSVLDQMARDMSWTQALGNAVLAQRPAVMDSVQHMRQTAMNYGYLRSNGQVQVANAGPGDIEITPVDPGYYYVPVYNPYVVYAAPRPGFFVGAAIAFGPRVYLGASFAPWGWGSVGFAWRSHDVVIDHHPWSRTWTNRNVYANSYSYRRPYTAPRVEHHDVQRVYRDHPAHEEHAHDDRGNDHH